MLVVRFGGGGLDGWMKAASGRFSMLSTSCRHHLSDVALDGLFCLVGIAVAGATPAQEKSQPFQTSTVGVVVDAIVQDRHGHPLPCLSQGDFVLTEDGAIQPITSFRWIGSRDCAGSRTPSGDRSPVAVATGKPPDVTAIVFEELGPEARFAAWRTAQAYVRELRQPTEFVGVYTLDTTLHVEAPETQDTAELLEGMRRAAMRPGCPMAVSGTIENVVRENLAGEGRLHRRDCGLRRPGRPCDRRQARSAAPVSRTTSTATSANPRQPPSTRRQPRKTAASLCPALFFCPSTISCPHAARMSRPRLFLTMTVTPRSARMPANRLTRSSDGRS
jgi:hypothetical protein